VSEPTTADQVFVERTCQLGLLGAALDATRAGSAPVVVLRGDAATGRGRELDAALVELAIADDFENGMARALAPLRRGTGAARVEWWAPSEGGDAFRLQAKDGAGQGRRSVFPVGAAGVLVFTGGTAPRIRTVVNRLAPLVRRRCVEEQLLRTATKLARRNEALEDFAALVAHELKTPLQAALCADDASSCVERALDLVDTLLDAARSECRSGTAKSASCLAGALADLGEVTAEIEAELPAELPLAPTALYVLLRNLVGNAVAAGAHHIRVAASPASGSWTLVVDDDGVGLSAEEGYASGSGLGLQLCRRLAERLGGVLEVDPRVSGGTRATVTVGCVA
jgi:signal transduction histidine kinase